MDPVTIGTYATKFLPWIMAYLNYEQGNRAAEDMQDQQRTGLKVAALQAKHLAPYFDADTLGQLKPAAQLQTPKSNKTKAILGALSAYQTGEYYKNMAELAQAEMQKKKAGNELTENPIEQAAPTLANLVSPQAPQYTNNQPGPNMSGPWQQGDIYNPNFMGPRSYYDQLKVDGTY